MKRIFFLALMAIGFGLTAQVTTINQNVYGSNVKDAMNTNFSNLQDSVDAVATTATGESVSTLRDSVVINTTQFQDSLGWFNVVSYGAVGDDATDNTTAIRNTVAAAGDGIVYFPPGVFRITDTILIEGSPTIKGAGWSNETRTGQTTIKQMRNKPIFHFYADDGAGGYGWEYGATIKQIQLVGSASADSSLQHALVFNGSNDALVDQVYVSNMGGHAVRLGELFHTHNISVQNSKFQSNKGDGIYGHGTSAIQINAITVDDVHIISNRYGTNLFGVNINIINSIIEDNDSVGVFFSARDLGEISSTSNNITVAGNYIETNGGGEIRVEPYWDGAAVFQQFWNLDIHNNYLASTSGSIDKSGVDHLITLIDAAGGTTGAYLLDFLKIHSNSYSYTDLGILDANNTLDITAVIDMPLENNHALWSNLEGPGQATGPTKIIKGIPMAAPDYESGIGAEGPTVAELHPFIRVALSAPIDITANPQIPDGWNGQEITFIGVDDTNTLTFDDGNGLSTGGTIALGEDDIITFKYFEWLDLWVCVYYKDN